MPTPGRGRPGAAGGGEALLALKSRPTTKEMGRWRIAGGPGARSPRACSGATIVR
jgi:hypothetical protein